MSVTRVSIRILVVLAAVVMVATSTATPNRKSPRIVSAVMQDSDRDARADGVRLTYSVSIRHARDRDGRYPFTVAGYRIRAVGAASGKTLVIALVEKEQPDTEARPAIRYRPTRSKPVTGLKGAQAAAQLYRSAQPHGHLPPAEPPPPLPPAPQPPAPFDSDGDGTPDTQDCAPQNAAIHPKAADLPDLAFVDSNCDGIDGTEKDAIFVSELGKDSNSGTKGEPKREVASAILAASLSGKDVYVAAGTYTRVEAKTGVGIYGGYDPAKWSHRSRSQVTVIAGSPEGVLVDDERGIVLQLLTIRGTSSGSSAYGIRAIDGSALTLVAVSVVAGDGAAGQAGVDGTRGVLGVLGGFGREGHCDSNQTVGSRWGGDGGKGAASPIGRGGGEGGKGGDVETYGGEAGQRGGTGQIGTLGGAGGSSGNPGKAGANGQPGSPGSFGARGAGGASTTQGASTGWVGAAGRPGIAGTHGSGGGGGGGGGAQTGLFVLDGPGNGGGGGGSGGGGGAGGGAGRAGAGSFAVYLHNSTLVATSSTVKAGAGGPGGAGGAGGPGGAPGGGGRGATKCTGEVGAGGNGGRGGGGGDGGGGGGGAGGPSIGILKVGTSSATLTETSVAVGAPGAAGKPGFGGTGTAAPAEAGIAQAIYP